MVAETIVGHLVSQLSVQMFLHMNLNNIVAGLLKDDEVISVDV